MRKARVHYRYAVVGFCQDLTDPKSGSLPVAVIGSGDLGEKNSFIFLMAATPDEVRDPIARELLAGMPRLLREELDQALAKAGPDRWLGWLGDHLRQNLHVTSIDDVTLEGLDVEDTKSLVDGTIQHFQQFLVSSRSWYAPSGPVRVGSASLPTFTLEALPLAVPAGHVG